MALSIVAIVISAFALLAGLWALRQRSEDTGRVKPITIKQMRENAAVFGSPMASWTRVYEESWAKTRAFWLFLYNRSAVRQSVVIENCSILWPRGTRFHLFDQKLEFAIEPNKGGNFALRFLDFDEENTTPETGRYLVRLKGETLSGHKLRYLGFVTFRPYRGEYTPEGDEDH